MSPSWVAPAISIGTSIFGGMKASSAAKKQAKAQNEAAWRQFEYNTELWEMSKDKLKADHAYLIDKIDIAKKNEQTLAAYTDKVANQKYQHNLAIRDYQQKSLQKQYEKSEQLYGARINQNEMSAQNAREGANRRFFELQQEVAFQNEDAELAMLEKRGAQAVKGQSGGSLGKSLQNIAARRGVQYARLTETIVSGATDLESQLREIALDKSAANMSAWAQRMLKPGVLPKPPAPLPTPVSEYQMPRPLEEFDFGPAPVLGATASVSAAGSSAFWGSAASGIGKGIAGLAGTINLGGGGGLTNTTSIWSGKDLDPGMSYYEIG